MLTIRLATPHDLDALNAIYNHYVLNSTCTYQYDPTTPEERRAWFAARIPAHPVTIAELTSPAGTATIVGFGSLSPFHPRAAYRFTVENSVYVHQAHHRQGIGKAILADLITRAQALGHRSIMALISADQTASIQLHLNAGFQQVAHLPKVGYKFDRWLDVVYYQRFLDTP